MTLITLKTTMFDDHNLGTSGLGKARSANKRARP